MKVTIENIAKKFEREWIFKSLSFVLNTGDKLVIKGGNGSGKSSILQILVGKSIPTKGNIKFDNEGKEINKESVFKYTSIASPFLELIEDFSLVELLESHFGLRELHPDIQLKDIPELLYLEKDKHKAIEYFSSGMKQRVKLALAILTNSPILLLDEPCSNLDKKGIDWYHIMIDRFGKDRIIVVASNEKTEEYPFCTKEMNIEDYK